MKLVHQEETPEGSPACSVCAGTDTEPCAAGYLCGTCGHVFKGTREEWDRYTLRRQARADDAAGRTPRHLRSV